MKGRESAVGKVKDILRKAARDGLWMALSLLPKDENKAVCQSYYGRGYSDSPKAIADELLSRGWKVYWTVKGEAEAATLPPGVTPIRLDSPRAIYHLCTAGVWVDNSRKWAYTQKRGSTCYVQTWHGFPLKRIEGDAQDALPPDYLRAAKKDSRMADLFLSNSRFLTEIYRRAFWYQGDVLEEGFKEFFEKEVLCNPLKAEYLIPIFIGELLEQGKMSVKVLKTNDTWYGMTYHEDVAAVKGSFKEMLENGVYKADLFSDL